MLSSTSILLYPLIPSNLYETSQPPVLMNASNTTYNTHKMTTQTFHLDVAVVLVLDELEEFDAADVVGTEVLVLGCEGIAEGGVAPNK